MLLVMKILLRSSIARCLLSGFLVVIIPVTIINLVVSYLSMKVTQGEVSRSYDNSLMLLSAQMESYLESYETIADVFMTDNDLSALNQSPNSSIVIWEYIETLKKLKFFSITNELDVNITLYLRNKNRSLSSRYGIDEIDNQVMINLGNNGFENIRNWRFIDLPTENTEALSYMSTPIYCASPRNIIITVDIEVSQVKDFLENLNIQGGGTCFIIDSKGYGVMPSNEYNIKIDDIIKTLMGPNKSNRQFIYSDDGEKYRVTYNSLSQVGLTIGMFIPESKIIQPIMKVRGWIFIILITSLGLALFYTIFTYQNIILPIRQLIKGMQAVSAGNFKVRMLDSKMEEMRFMYTQFNCMVEQIDSLINEVYEEKINAQRSKLKLLQSQINPHFLYNCLNFIYRMAGSENIDGISKMSLYLGKYFRYATKLDRDTTSLKDEMDNIRSYIQIQELRYPEKINYYEEIQQEVLDILIPRLLIQPVIENIFVHGVEKIRGSISICVKARKQEEKVTIAIEDSGAGIETKKLREINESLKKSNQEGTSFGLRNIYWRLKLKFGEEADFRLENVENGGTRAIFIIPANEV